MESTLQTHCKQVVNPYKSTCKSGEHLILDN
jgi:hypothetical protein